MIKQSETIESQINKVLAEWNPIGVPDDIALLEYSSYVDEIASVIADREQLRLYLVNLVSEVIGLPYDDLNRSHRDDMDNVINKLQSLK